MEIPQSYKFYVRGISYKEERIQTSMILEIGQNLSYKRDIENLYDPYAIKIFYEERELGFVPREYSKSIATEIDLNNVEYDIVISKIEPIRNYQNIEVEMHVRQ
jgi:helicase